MRAIVSFVFLTLLYGYLINCCTGSRGRTADQGPRGQSSPAVSVSRISSPGENQLYTSGDGIEAILEILSDTIRVDSVEFFLSGIRSGVAYRAPFEYMLASDGLKVGTLPLRTVTWYNGGKSDTRNLSVVLRSDIRPGNIAYRVVNSYPHDIHAYTQGLVYNGGFLYEGTGRYNESSLRKVVIETGETVRTMNLPSDIFGEGITILDGKIYQLTYKSQVGFVYDMGSFRRLQKIYYQNKEGWGLTHDRENLIMSDGSNRLYFMDPEYFTQERQLEVYDNEGPVSRLNELEYIEGKIFANVYGEQRIVIIDPASGKITGQLDMNGILPEKERHSRIDVFNGIAWDRDNKRMYVTGKYWPLLFEVIIEDSF